MALASNISPPEDLTPSQAQVWHEITSSITGLKNQNVPLIRLAAESGARYKAISKHLDLKLDDESFLSSLIVTDDKGKETIDPRVSLMLKFQKSYEDSLKQLGASPTKLMKAVL